MFFTWAGVLNIHHGSYKLNLVPPVNLDLFGYYRLSNNMNMATQSFYINRCNCSASVTLHAHSARYCYQLRSGYWSLIPICPIAGSKLVAKSSTMSM